jgi:ribA/ribD-fused uncharacterized protein
MLDFMSETANVRDAVELADLQRQGKRLKFLFFWGHRPPRDGGVGAGCLSQWWPAAFTVDGVRYPTAEHYMMAEKARLFDDTAAADSIVAAPHPKRAKDLGRRVSGFDEAVWAEHRYDIVVRGTEAKFAGNQDLAEYLLTTGSRVLVEASPTDRVWGIGMAADDDRAESVAAWQGLNLLGFALMEVRERLRQDGGRPASGS